MQPAERSTAVLAEPDCAHPGEICPTVRPARSSRAYAAAGDLLRALAAPVRIAIVLELREAPCCVHDLVDALAVPQPLVSQHLRVLKEAGLVAERAAGTRRIYRLNPAGVAALRDQLDTFWNRALAGYQDSARQQHRQTAAEEHEEPS